MADKLIHLLTDTQAAYDKDIYLPTDDVTFTNTKKVKMGTIYPLIDSLSTATTFNATTSTTRISDGSYVEKKITIDSLLSAYVTAKINTTSEITFSGDSGVGLSVIVLGGRFHGKVQFITGKIANTEWGSEIYLKTIVNYTSPGFVVHFAMSPVDDTAQSGFGRIDVDGKIYLTPWRDDQVWHFSVTVIGI